MLWSFAKLVPLTNVINWCVLDICWGQKYATPLVVNNSFFPIKTIPLPLEVVGSTSTTSFQKYLQLIKQIRFTKQYIEINLTLTLVLGHYHSHHPMQNLLLYSSCKDLTDIDQ